MIREVKNLKKQLSWRRLDDLGLEYRYVAKYLKGELNRTEMEEMLKKEIYRFAKRQLTWFRKDKGINWVSTATQAERLVQQFLK